ncbi:MAG: bifunctional UDP-N-acetylglucosamine diphosphorylase/glucosamine-1-phosphate N-acetyltransferase GlmU [Dongiaceae bacterium]
MAKNSSLSILILAAGQSKRMRSSIPKVMHSLAGRPMLYHLIDTARSLKPEKLAVVIGKEMEKLPGIPCVTQHPARGTGHAVQVAAKELKNTNGPVLILYGDTPLVTPGTLHQLIDALKKNAVAILGFRPLDPGQYARLVTDKRGQLKQIVEFKDADNATKKIDLCNAGVMAVQGKHLWNLLNKLQTNNAAKEYYLTDLVKLANAQKLSCTAIEASEEEVIGINTRGDLALAERFLQDQLRARHLANGVTMQDPASVYFSWDTEINSDVTIEPHVYFGPGVSIGEGTTIKAFCHIEGAIIGRNTRIGPFARLRPGTELEDAVHIGNFVEAKNTKMAKGAKANHLTYLGDTVVGEGANIGAGTITCNYDGFNKSKTTIGKGAFIGSNTALVAPIKVGDNAIIAAGSVITEDVANEDLALSRTPQINKRGLAKRMRQKLSNKKSKK